MYYEINIAHDKQHFFTTHPRSITGRMQLMMVFTILNRKFPEAEGYEITVTYYPDIGIGINGASLQEAIESGGLSAVDSLFESA